MNDIDFNEIMRDNFNKGVREGLEAGLEKGRVEGFEDGMEKGVEKGIKQGLEQGKAEQAICIAKSMLSQGIALEVISTCTGISLKKLKDIQCSSEEASSILVSID